MMSLVKLVTLFTSLIRVLRNIYRTQISKKIVKKLETNFEYRKSKLEEMDYTLFKKVDPEYLKLFSLIKLNAINIQTEKFKVKSVIEIDLNVFLIFVLCIDSEIEVVSANRNKSVDCVKLMYFKVGKNSKESELYVKSYFYIDNEEKFLMNSFFKEIEKIF